MYNSFSCRLSFGCVQLRRVLAFVCSEVIYENQAFEITSGNEYIPNSRTTSLALYIRNNALETALSFAPVASIRYAVVALPPFKISRIWMRTPSVAFGRPLFPP